MTRKLTKIILFLFGSCTLSVNAQSTFKSNEEIGKSYLQAANDNLRQGNVEGACANLTNSYKYFQAAKNNGEKISDKILQTLQDQQSKTCAYVQQTQQKSISQTFVEGAIKADACNRLKEISYSCAAAGSYDQCMKIRVGNDYKDGLSYCSIR